jgi:uncharacterized membrane protein YeaQ/YmgE (transglycosylase-associated protein family)
MSALLIVNTVWAAPRTAVLGLVVTAVGAVVYLVIYRPQHTR